MASIMAAANVAASATTATTATRARSSRAVAPAALRRSSATAGRRASSLVVRAADDGFSFEDAKNKYMELTYKIPPVVTAAAVPIVGLSLLCKAITGSGLPGDVLGGLEGLSWLALPLGAGSLLPRVTEITTKGDYSTDAIIKALTAKGGAYGGFGEDANGKNATERINNITKKTDPNSPLGMQMADIARREAEKAAETPEQTAAREKLRSELAAMALGLGKSISKAGEE